jgi:hypothetical protein
VDIQGVAAVMLDAGNPHGPAVLLNITAGTFEFHVREFV